MRYASGWYVNLFNVYFADSDEVVIVFSKPINLLVQQVAPEFNINRLIGLGGVAF
jgi:hypothetical protein